MSEGETPGPPPETRTASEPGLFRPGLGMSRRVFGAVVLLAVVACAASGSASNWNPATIGLTALLAALVIGAVVLRSQRDLLQFRSEHGRWPRTDEIDAWNA